MDQIDVIFRSWPEFLLAFAILGLSQVVHVLFGFGAGLVAVGTLALFLPIQDIVVMLLLITTPVEAYVAIKSRKKISWRAILLLLVGVILGVPLGTFLLRFGQPTMILNFLGVFLVIQGAIFLIFSRPMQVRIPSVFVPGIGMASGILTALFSTGGPPLILYFQLTGVKKSIFRAQLMAIFVVVAIVRFASYSVSGFITTERLFSAIAILPAVFLGVFLGQKLHINVSEKTFRKLVCCVLILIGAVLLAKNLSGISVG